MLTDFIAPDSMITTDASAEGIRIVHAATSEDLLDERHAGDIVVPPVQVQPAHHLVQHEGSPVVYNLMVFLPVLLYHVRRNVPAKPAHQTK